jgi:hypothetical protein
MRYGKKWRTVLVLVDSSSQLNLVDFDFAEDLGIPVKEIEFADKIKEHPQLALRKPLPLRQELLISKESFLLKYELKDRLGNKYTGEDQFYVAKDLMDLGIVGVGFIKKHNIPVTKLERLKIIRGTD